MSVSIPSVSSVSEAWLLSLEQTLLGGAGRVVHLITTVTEPGKEDLTVRLVLDKLLEKRGSQSIQTIAETIFPTSLYLKPEFNWVPGISSDRQRELDEAAQSMYSTYVDMIPLLLTANGNRLGTYFGRMITWPGKEAGGVNQLAARVNRLRSEHTARRKTHNTLDIDVAADAATDDDWLRGIQVYAATDKRIRGFPCLTHIDLTLHERRLHAVAVYRHQYLIEKAYGNMLGLSWLMQFLCQQSGYELGEMVIHATLADAQRGTFGSDIPDLVQSARSILKTKYLAGVDE